MDFFKGTGVTPTEQTLAQWAERVFLPLWAYPNVYRQAGKELCDLLAVVGNDILIFSDKRIKFELPRTVTAAGNMNPVAWHRWVRKAIFSSAKQLWRAEGIIKKGGARFYRDSAAKHPLNFSFDTLESKCHLILVANGANDAMKEFWGIDKSPMLILNSCLQGQENHLSSENGMLRGMHFDGEIGRFLNLGVFQVGDLAPDKTFVHIFDEIGFSHVMGELDTGTDFLNYLIKRDAVFRNKKFKFIAPDEEAMLLDYMSDVDDQGMHDFFFISEAEKNGGVTLLDEAKLNDKKLQQINKKKKADQISYFWDNMVNASIRGSMSQISTDSEYGRAFAVMARESRLTRRLICEHIHEKASARPSGMMWQGMHDSIVPGVFYLIIFAPEDGLQAQGAALKALCAVALVNHKPHSRAVIGIFNGPQRLSICYISKEELNSDVVKSARAMCEKCGWGKNIKRSMKSYKEYPD